MSKNAYRIIDTKVSLHRAFQSYSPGKLISFKSMWRKNQVTSMQGHKTNWLHSSMVTRHNKYLGRGKCDLCFHKIWKDETENETVQARPAPLLIKWSSTRRPSRLLQLGAATVKSRCSHASRAKKHPRLWKPQSQPWSFISTTVWLKLRFKMKRTCVLFSQIFLKGTMMNNREKKAHYLFFFRWDKIQTLEKLYTRQPGERGAK